MTINDLFRILELAIHDGHGEGTIWFDTEARTYSYHMAKVGRAYCQEDFIDPGKYIVTLHEERT